MYIFQDFKGIHPVKVLYGLIVGTNTRAIFLFRLSSWCNQHNIKVFDTIFWSLNVALHSCDINPAAKIGSGLNLVHTTGIVLGPIKAGKKLTIFQNATAGFRGATKENREHATLGDNVTLYAGSVISGNVHIGNKVNIGANSVVLDDVPSNSTAVGAPARIINNKRA